MNSIRHKLLKTSLIAMMLMLAVLVTGLLRYSVTASERAVTQSVQPLLAAAATIQTSATIGSSYMPQCRESAVYIQWSAGTSAGAVQIESAHSETYAGTWAPLGPPVAWNAVSKEDIVQITGIHGALRTRLSTGVTGGTVSTWIVCN